MHPAEHGGLGLEPRREPADEQQTERDRAEEREVLEEVEERHRNGARLRGGAHADCIVWTRRAGTRSATRVSTRPQHGQNAPRALRPPSHGRASSAARRAADPRGPRARRHRGRVPDRGRGPLPDQAHRRRASARARPRVQRRPRHRRVLAACTGTRTTRPGSSSRSRRSATTSSSGSFRVSRLGLHLYTVHAWLDRFGSWRRDLEKRIEAGQDIAVDLEIGTRLVEAAAANASGQDRRTLEALAAKLADPRHRAPRTRSSRRSSS